jgi:hypothetical protein
MIVTIKVTQGHIRQGCRQNCEFCPIALAVIPFIKKTYRLTVGQAINIRDAGGKLLWYIFLERIASNFIRLFDMAEPVEPFEFQIDIPEIYLERSAA